MPGLIHDPGRGAGYAAGQNRMFMAVDHDTGGTNSYNICKWGRDGYDTGLCQILLPKVGVPWQFTEIDAICYHAGSAQYGDYNPYGPGFEVERLQGEPLSPDQIHWLGEIGRWCESEWGLPNVHYWGPQFPPWGANFHGYVNHRDIHPNPDGLSPEEWAAVIGATPVPSLIPGACSMLMISESDSYFAPKGSLWLTVPGWYCVRVAQGQTWDQALHNWGALPRCPVPGAFIDGIIGQILQRDAKLTKAAA